MLTISTQKQKISSEKRNLIYNYCFKLKITAMLPQTSCWGYYKNTKDRERENGDEVNFSQYSRQRTQLVGTEASSFRAKVLKSTVNNNAY